VPQLIEAFDDKELKLLYPKTFKDFKPRLKTRRQPFLFFKFVHKTLPRRLVGSENYFLQPGMFERRCSHSCTREVVRIRFQGLPENIYWKMHSWKCKCHVLLQILAHRINNCVWNKFCDNYFVLFERILPVPILACLPTKTRRLWNRTAMNNWKLMEK